MTFDTLILTVAAGLFVVALIALTAWAFKTFFPGRRNGLMRPRERRLGVVETASVDQKRKLLLIRRDDVEHLIIIGGPVDMVVETGIKPYDIAALVPIIAGAGGIVTTWEGEPAQNGGRIVAAGDKRTHEEAMKILAGK